MGLDDLAPFDPQKNIIEYVLEDESTTPLLNMKLDPALIEDERAISSSHPCVRGAAAAPKRRHRACAGPGPGEMRHHRSLFGPGDSGF